MVTVIEFVGFTVVPICAMGAVVAYIAMKIRAFDDVRPLFLIAFLSLMTVHQLTEVGPFVTGTYYRTTSPIAEAFETTANLLASVASYLVMQQLTELRATRNELRQANDALEERSSMVSVLNRILRHNVRNDVNIIAGRAADMHDRVTESRLRKDLKTIEERALGLAAISDRTYRIEQLEEEDASRTTELRLPDRLEAPIERIRTAAPEATVTLDTADGSDLVAVGPSVLPTIVADVVEQLVAANDGSTHVEVTVGRETRREDERDWVTIVVHDDGVGLPDPDVRAIEHEKETPLRHGKGLSLWSLKWAVDRSDGTLDIRADGRTVEIRLPRATDT